MVRGENPYGDGEWALASGGPESAGLGVTIVQKAFRIHMTQSILIFSHKRIHVLWTVPIQTVRPSARISHSALALRSNGSSK